MAVDSATSKLFPICYAKYGDLSPELNPFKIEEDIITRDELLPNERVVVLGCKHVIVAANAENYFNGCPHCTKEIKWPEFLANNPLSAGIQSLIRNCFRHQGVVVGMPQLLRTWKIIQSSINDLEEEIGSPQSEEFQKTRAKRNAEVILPTITQELETEWARVQSLLESPDLPIPDDVLQQNANNMFEQLKKIFLNIALIMRPEHASYIEQLSNDILNDTGLQAVMSKFIVCEKPTLPLIALLASELEWFQTNKKEVLMALEKQGELDTNPLLNEHIEEMVLKLLKFFYIACSLDSDNFGLRLDFDNFKINGLSANETINKLLDNAALINMHPYLRLLKSLVARIPQHPRVKEFNIWTDYEWFTDMKSQLKDFSYQYRIFFLLKHYFRSFVITSKSEFGFTYSKSVTFDFLHRYNFYQRFAKIATDNMDAASLHLIQTTQNIGRATLVLGAASACTFIWYLANNVPGLFNKT